MGTRSRRALADRVASLGRRRDGPFFITSVRTYNRTDHARAEQELQPDALALADVDDLDAAAFISAPAFFNRTPGLVYRIRGVPALRRGAELLRGALPS